MRIKISCHACQRTPSRSSLTFSRGTFVTVFPVYIFFPPSARQFNRARKPREISLALPRTARSRLNPKTTRTSPVIRPRPPVRRRCVRPMASHKWGAARICERTRSYREIAHRAAPRRRISGPPPPPVLWDHDGPHSRCPFITN